MNAVPKKALDRHLGPEMTMFAVRIPQSMLQSIERFARGKRSKGSIIREALTDWLKTRQKLR